MYCRHRFRVLERDVSSSPLLPRLKAQGGDQVEDTERTPAQNEQNGYENNNEVYNTRVSVYSHIPDAICLYISDSNWAVSCSANATATSDR